MIFLFLECSPTENAPEFGEVIGAFVTLWIDTNSTDKAIKRAHEIIEEDLWEIVEYEAPTVVTEASYFDNPEGLEGFQEAKMSGEYHVFYMYDEEDDDEDEDEDEEDELDNDV